MREKYLGTQASVHFAQSLTGAPTNESFLSVRMELTSYRLWLGGGSERYAIYKC